MNSRALPDFWRLYAQLPKDIRRRAAKAYWIWRSYPRSPGLQFKRIGNRRPVYSVRVNDDYRALGLLEENTIYWFWIGPHDEYERIIKGM
jgi:hypothetical protein